jgi:hypothetical protein
VGIKNKEGKDIQRGPLECTAEKEAIAEMVMDRQLGHV